MKQKEYDQKLESLYIDLANKYKEIHEIADKIFAFKQEADKIKTPHALIPKQYKSIQEWLEGHPYPENVKSMVFESRYEAYRVQLCCNAYQYEYHIVKVEEK